MMIDWVTARVPCNHGREITGGAMVSYKDAHDFGAGTDWFFAKPLPVVGSHDSNVRIKTSAFWGEEGLGRELRIDGNLVKFFQGHNLFGSCDMVGLVAAFMDHLCTIPQLGLCPTDLQRQMWYNGAYEVSRVDLTTMVQLRNLPDVLAWLATAEHSATLNHRGRGQLTKGSTLYFGKHSRRWSLKFYAKGQELTAKGHELHRDLLMRDQLLAYAQPALRSELTLRSMQLKETELQLASNWPRDGVGISQLFNGYMKGLNMSDVRTLPAEILDGLQRERLGRRPVEIRTGCSRVDHCCLIHFERLAVVLLRLRCPVRAQPGEQQRDALVGRAVHAPDLGSTQALGRTVSGRLAAPPGAQPVLYDVDRLLDGGEDVVVRCSGFD